MRVAVRLCHSEAGDLIESRSPELAAHARTAIRIYGEANRRQAE